MAVAEDLDLANSSAWGWAAEQTRTYLASGGTEGAREPVADDGRSFPLHDEYARKTDRLIPIVLLTQQN